MKEAVLSLKFMKNSREKGFPGNQGSSLQALLPPCKN